MSSAMSWLEWHHADVLNSLLELQEDEAFSDLKLSLRDGQVCTMRSLVAALSPVFRSLVAGAASQNNSQPLKLQSVSVEAWRCVVSFYYSDRKHVTAENVEEMIAVADRFELTHLKNYCDVVLADFVTMENCLNLLKIAYRYKLQNSSSKITHFVAEHLDSICRTEQFFTLDPDEMQELLENPALAASEDVLCGALLAWLDRACVEQGSAALLLSQLHLADLSTDCIYRQLMYHAQVVADDNLKKLITKELQRRLSSPSGQQSAFSCKKRDPRASEVTLAFGHDGKDMQGGQTGAVFPPSE